MTSTVFETLREIDPDAYLALKFVALECIGQRQREGWSTEHDDSHDKGEMASAAAAYAAHAAIAARDGVRDTRHREAPFGLWPWDWAWWKPKTVWRDLTRAAALIVAEMGRRIRKNCADYAGAVHPTQFEEHGPYEGGAAELAQKRMDRRNARSTKEGDL